MKDLIRALRGDSDQCEIRRHLGKAQVLQKVVEITIINTIIIFFACRHHPTSPPYHVKDLMPLLVHYSDDTRLRNDVIRYVHAGSLVVIQGH